MSKVDAQRAMREAKYARSRANGVSRREEAQAAASTGSEEKAPTAKARPLRTESVPGPAVEALVEAGPAPEVSERCGHKSMNGRSCTREAGHAEKNHRYS